MYAIEVTNMVEHAREVACANSVTHIVEVIKGTMEDIELLEKGETGLLMFIL